MFIFAKGVKELLVTSGVAISCCLFVVLALRQFASGVWGLVFGLFLLLLVIAVLRGNKAGYLATRYIWTFSAFVTLFGCLLNPMAWEDSLWEGFGMIGIGLLIFPSAFCLSYSLSEHAKLRKLKGAQRWRSLPLPLKWVLLLFGAGAAGFVALWLAITGTSKQEITATSIGVLKSKLATYKQLHGVYPAPEEWVPFESHVEKGDSKLRHISDLKDMWGTSFIYRFPGKRYPDSFDLFSAGPDRTPDTADDEWGQ